MDRIKTFLDWLARSPPPEIQEAERENMKYDKKRLDKSLGRMLQAHDEFSEIVAQVVADVGHERRQRRAHEKAITRSRKT